MFLGIERQQPLLIAAQDCGGGDHLGVEQRVRREAAQEVPAMTVGPIHHGRNGNSAIQVFHLQIILPLTMRSPSPCFASCSSVKTNDVPQSVGPTQKTRSRLRWP